MAKIILFTCNDFSTTSGGTIRMYGILNALAENSNEVILISNTTDYSDFHPNIRHIFLNHPINSYSKRKFQLLLSILPISWLNYYYRKLFRNEELSLGFSPSDVQDLARVMNLALDNYDQYRQKYSHTRDFILKYMTYQHQTKVLERVNHGQAH